MRMASSERRMRSAAEVSHGLQADEDGEQHGKPNRVISGGHADHRAHGEQPGDDACDSGSGT